jgi:hypothetical protein
MDCSADSSATGDGGARNLNEKVAKQACIAALGPAPLQRKMLDKDPADRGVLRAFRWK